MIVGNNQSIWSSTDSVNWDEAFSTQLTRASWYFDDLTFDGHSFQAVDGQGAIYQSQSSAMVGVPTLVIRRTENPNEVGLVIGDVTGQIWDLL